MSDSKTSYSDEDLDPELTGLSEVGGGGVATADERDRQEQESFKLIVDTKISSIYREYDARANFNYGREPSPKYVACAEGLRVLDQVKDDAYVIDFFNKNYAFRAVKTFLTLDCGISGIESWDAMTQCWRDHERKEHAIGWE